MSATTQAHKDMKKNMLPEFDASKLLKAPFKVLLCNAVYQNLDDAGTVIETVIPDPDGLLKAVAQARVLHHHKLSGADLKFLRSAMGLKAKDFARRIAVSPEHLSRCENGSLPLSPQGERLARVYTFVSTLRFTSKRNANGQQIGEMVAEVFEGMSIKSAHAIEEELVLDFVLDRRPSHAGQACCAANDDDGVWDQLQTRCAVG